MRQAVLDRLLQINRGFYQSFAEPFGEARSRLQPGVLRALEGLPGEAVVLDLGCGNGGLAAELQRRGHAGLYVGVDSSEALLEQAHAGDQRPGWRFVSADLAGEDWPERARGTLAEAQAAGGPGALFHQIFAFAVLHHIPGEILRTRLVRQVGELLAPDGRLTLSVWNFLASPRLRARIQSWREAGLAEAELEPGDYLLDWRRGGRGLRYVHHFTEPELEALAAAGGFRVVGTYLSDGEGGMLGRYQTWEPGGRAEGVPPPGLG